MRRTFPLRPSETSLLVSYDNGAYEHDIAEADVSSSSSCNLKSSSQQDLHRRRSSTSFSVTFCEDNSSQQRSSQKFRSSSVYPEFSEATSPSSRSSLWTCSFHDDGDSTSFNFSDGTHRRATSSLSSSSSSSISYDPMGSAAFTANPLSKDLDAQLDTSCKDVNSHIGIEFAACEDSISPQGDPHTAIVSSIKPPLKPLRTSHPPTSSQRGTPIHVVPKKVQDNMRVQMATSTNRRLSHRSASSPKVAARSVESSRSCSCLPRSRKNLRAPPISPKANGCSVPFKYLAKCLRTEKSKTPKKERSNSIRVNSPAKFSTLLNELYAGESPCQGKAPPKGRATRETEHSREELPATKDSCSSTPRSLARGRIDLYASDACSASDEGWQSPLKGQSFGTNMVSDYVRHMHEVGKSASFRKAPTSSSFHHDLESVPLKEFKRRSSSMDLTQKPGKASSKCSYKVVTNGRHLNHKDCDRPLDLLVGEETKNLALLTREISKLCKDRRLLARELAAEIKSRQCEQKAAENAIKDMEAAMEEKLISVEKDHAYAQACLEKEIDRRKKEWSAKLDNIKLEENKLRERVTEMALERVELQKCIAFYKGREASLQTQAKDHELSAQAWMRRHRQSEEEVLLLRQSFRTVCNKLGDKEHELDLVLQRSKVLERENAELLKEFSRLRRAYADQETTFEELWQRLIDIMNGASDCKVDSLRRLHGELKVFSVREQALRYEISVLQSQLYHMKQKGGPFAEENFSSLEGSRMFSPKEHPSFTKKPSLQHKTSETLDDLVKKLELTKQHMRRAEHQLEVKEEEVELLHSTMTERDHAMRDLQEELMSVKAHRDGLRKQVQQMGQEALKLTLELSELRNVVEKLDDELMLKEGQITILRDTCSDSDF